MNNLNERDNYAYEYAGYLAHRMVLSCSSKVISYHNKEDLQSEILLSYFENVKSKLDDREVGWKGYIQKSLNNVMYAFINKQKKNGKTKEK